MLYESSQSTRNMTSFCSLFLLLIACCFGAVPQENFFEGVFKGEGVNCDGTFARVFVSSEQVVRTEEGVVTAVSEAIAQNTGSVTDVPTAVAAAQDSAQLIVEVVSEAAATVTGFINSPAPTCWAIAFGKAQAVAIANATVTAIAQGIARALEGEEVLAQVETVVQSETSDIAISVETIALLLADGSGGGFQFESKSARAVARARAINCALARAFAQLVEDGEDEAIVLTAAGCDEVPIPEPELPPVDGCECMDESMGQVPGGCGKWGDIENGDTICYVKDPDNCPCAWATDRYENSGAYWRYCGPTLEAMQGFLNFEDTSGNDIIGVPSGSAFCARGTWNPSRDTGKIAPDPSPTPSPPSTSPASPPLYMTMVPPQEVETLQDCPQRVCRGLALSCCSTLENTVDTCRPSLFINFKLGGRCGATDQKVLIPSQGSWCVCENS
eukprot:TRINITY_DN16254_c0_g1_i1.p1 TRINITY_DN16254_c0_g1~~TRINITY_DN16254_c0_g1_i1.p1  ORF type:complete len:454 (-),score=64.26 TRINITY_DN16254_c0_g1_i1:365-1693(-)